ncbi:MAG: serine/threonine protein kinase [Vulcanimicrobiota bacterium]
MVCSLVHPGLPRIFDFFIVERSHYIVMEYIDGETLEEKLKSLDEPFPWEEVLAWAEELCGILDFLHSRKHDPVIFRDLKPSNIMIDTDGKRR